jgi:hypothetical protein
LHAVTKHGTAECPEAIGGMLALDRAIRACLLVATVVLIAGSAGFVLVWAGVAVPGWSVSAALLAVAVVLAMVRALVVRRCVRSSGATGAPRRRAPWRILATAVVVVLASAGLVADLSATYTVLTPAGPGACRLAAREHSFLFAGGGEVYAVGAAGLGRSVGSWTADDGGQPVASGRYELEWDGEEALLSLSSDPGNPVWPAVHTVSCP